MCPPHPVKITSETATIAQTIANDASSCWLEFHPPGMAMKATTTIAIEGGLHEPDLRQSTKLDRYRLDDAGGTPR